MVIAPEVPLTPTLSPTGGERTEKETPLPHRGEDEGEGV